MEKQDVDIAQLCAEDQIRFQERIFELYPIWRITNIDKEERSGAVSFINYRIFCHVHQFGCVNPKQS